ncbi:MAG: hypothetical protein JXM79_09815 [Sedimentisphaerales bacterium]|nr:hypothetical protein [Sedimentisphaerales bacterium]
MLIKRASIIILVLIFGLSNYAVADHAFAHTHIGINPTWRPADGSNPGVGAVDLDPTDDDKLWFFSVPPVHFCATPGWPNWEQTNGTPFLVLTPVKEGDEHITKPDDPTKELYTCRFTYSKADGYGDPNGYQHLDGWHSAHGPLDAWNLESVDANTVPAWDIYVRRERISDNLDEDDFFLLLPDDTPTLESNGDVYFLSKQWLADQNAWGIHEHMGFYFWLDEGDEEVSVVFSAHDAGDIYQRSADFVISFAKTVCQPITGDLNEDGIVDILDLEIVIEQWGQSGIYRGEDQEALDHDHES